MSEQQRQCRAEFVRDQPIFWLFIIYAGGFLACSVCLDLWAKLTGDTSGLSRYLFPLGLAIPPWLGLRNWAQKVLMVASSG